MRPMPLPDRKPFERHRHSRAALALLALAVLAPCLGLASCASVASLDRADSAAIGGLLAEGRADDLYALSSQPFAVDQEIVPIPADIRDFWQAMASGGLRLAAADGSAPASVPAGPESWRAFAPTMDMRIYFARLGDPSARLLSLSSADGRQVLLLVGRPAGKLRVYGIKGPF